MPDTKELLDDGLRYEKSGALERALACYLRAEQAAAEPALVAKALCLQASVRRFWCEWDEAIAAARRAAAMARDLELPDLLAEALSAEAAVHLSRGTFQEGVLLFEQVVALARDEHLRGSAVSNLGAIAAQSGDLAGAEARFREAFLHFERADDRWGMAFALTNHGVMALDRQDYDTAEEVLQQAIATAREVEDLDLLALATMNLGDVYTGRGNHEQAESLVSTALGYFCTTNNRWRQVQCYRALGEINVACGSPQSAVSCFQTGLRLALHIDASVEIEKIRAALGALGASEAPEVPRRDSPALGSVLNSSASPPI